MMNVDITNCESEPIRFPGSVQPHGVLLVVAPDSGIIEAASESCQGLFGFSAESLLGQSLTLILGDDAARLAGQSALVPLALNGRQFLCRQHVNSNGQLLLDIEVQNQANAALDMQYGLRLALKQLRALTDLSAISQEAVQQIRQFTGYDRVMIYRFDADWNGEVIAEACDSDTEPFLGLHFPASDIPKQARDLFQSSKIRLISDALYTPSALLARQDSRSIDLGLSSLRSVSPMHIQYLANMQVRGSLVGSLVVADRLWGLVACHQLNTPKYFDLAEREVLSWFCEDLSLLIETTQSRLHREMLDSLAYHRQKLLNTVREIDLTVLMQQEDCDEILAVISADGLALVTDDNIYSCGITPEPHQIKALLLRRFEAEKNTSLYASSNLHTDLGFDDDSGIAGAVFVTIFKYPRSHLIWFRRERSYSIRWGGDPAHAHLIDESGQISPRKSFAQFLQNISGTSLPWQEAELSSAQELGTLIEIEEIRKEQAFALTLLNSSPEKIAILDKQGIIVLVNEAWKRAAAVDEMPELNINPVGKNYQHICDTKDYYSGEIDPFDALLGIKAVLNGELSYFSLDYPCHLQTKPRWFRMHVYPMRPPCEGVAVLHENITHNKLAELQLEYEHTQLRTLLETIPDLVWLKDPDGVYMTCNRAFEQLTGVSEAEIVGKTDTDFMLKAKSDFFRSEILVTNRLNAIEHNNESIINAIDGRQIVLETTRSAMRDVQGNLLGILAIGHDVTARKIAKQRILNESQKYVNLLNAASDGIHILDEHGKLLEFSDSFAEMLGYSRAETANLSVFDWDVEIPHTELSELIKDLFKESRRFETRHRRKDGSVFDVEIHARGIVIDGLRCLYNSARDITKRKLLERKLQESAQEIQDLYDNAPCGYHSVDSNGTILRINNTELKWLGYEREEIEGKRKSGEFLTSSNPNQYHNTFAGLLEDGHIGDLEFELVGKNGMVRNIILNATAIRDADGNFLMSRSVLHDITERKRIETQLELRDRRKDEFLAMLGHELRNPLAPIRYAVYWLKNQDVSDPLITRNYDIIDRQVDHITRLIDDLLDTARITQGKITLKKEPVLLNDVVNNAIDACRPLILEREQVLIIDLDATPLWIKGDPARLTQVISNLLNNAAKYTAKQGKITLTTRRDQAEAVIDVKDNGIGIAPNDINDIFDLFFQIRHNQADAPSGLGLGLALVNRLVKMHDGAISAASDGIGLGSTFSVRLPILATPIADNGSGSANSELAPHKLRILIVDDYPEVADGLAMNLRLQGHQVEIADCGLAGIKQALVFRPQVALIDIGLPDISGYEVAKQLRSIPEIQGAILIALTGFGQENDRSQAYAAGFNHHLLKPLNFAKFADILQNL
ncbi:PAS domain S-box protein [Methylomonas paludis]|uniref:histidine kinase n=1 Tax=Methylomonas paludis TaxID=1173101 RepID=A0A975ML71_9GAMM|nr:PAS domain S-box protein [Methylomonas paludis]QWF69850.1 PAS domain S-box protein [Methylomonas paludis]